MKIMLALKRVSACTLEPKEGKSDEWIDMEDVL